MNLSVTGHRPDKLGGYTQESSNRLVSIAIEWLVINKNRLNIEYVMTGMALGWDMAVAQACVDIRLPFIACIPFPGQEKLWSEPKQIYYRWLLSCAEDIVIVSKGMYTSAKMQKRNMYMVDNSSMLLAMHNGSKGGTFNCIKYATEQKKPIINLYHSHFR